VVATLVITRTWASLIAAGGLIALVLLAHWIIVARDPDPKSVDPVRRRRRGVKALVIGADGRASTSKVQPVLWTFAVFFAFVFLLVWGRSSGCGAHSGGAACREAVTGRAAFERTINRGLQSEYYVLLGIPLAAAVAARALVTNKVAAGTLTKTPIGSDTPPGNDASSAGSADTEAGASSGVVQGLSEIVSNDQGQADLLDFQYFAFNLVTLTFFFVEFLTHPSGGLPDLPTTLIALSGVSAAAYTTKKALETDVGPAITAVIPPRAPRVPQQRLAVNGNGFGPAPPAGTAGDGRSAVLLEGVKLQVVDNTWTDSRVVVELTAEVLAALPDSAASSGSFQLTVVDDAGMLSDAYAVELYPPLASTGSAPPP
jgi:hypothetical protein